jgi:hypothetical protein
MNTTILDRPAAATMTPNAAKWLSSRLSSVEQDLSTIRDERTRLLAELASMDVLVDDLQATADRYRYRLGDTVSMLPPLDGDEQQAEQQPVEAAAQAAVEQAKGEHPYAQKAQEVA